MIKLKTMNARLIIKNYPSQTELFMILEKFLEERKMEKCFSSEVRGQVVNFIFNDADCAYRFMKLLNYYKQNNDYYKLLDVKLINEASDRFKSMKSVSPRRIRNKIIMPTIGYVELNYIL
jgi:hypothetical protein